MNDIEDHYRPPASVEASEDTARLSRAEWRYVAKVFAIATVAASMVWGTVHTLQMSFALQQFGGEDFAARVVGLSALRQGGVTVAVFAASCALVLVINRRTVANLGPPNRGMLVPAIVALPVVTPLAGSMICVCSLLLLRVAYGQPHAVAWDSMRNTLSWSDASFSMMYAAVHAVLLAALMPDIARRLARVRGWTIPKILVIAWVTKLGVELALRLFRYLWQ